MHESVEKLRGQIYSAALFVVEKKAGPVNLEVRENASLEEGWRLDREDRDWYSAAQVFYSIYNNENLHVIDRKDAAIGLSQMLINLGRFRQAQQVLNGGIFSEGGEHPGYLYHRAQMYQKLGWIASVEGNYPEAISKLGDAIELAMRENPLIKNTQETATLIATCNHFIGRSCFGLARQGVEKESNLAYCRECFEDNIRYYADLRKIGLADPSAEGFEHAWNARVALTQDDIERARHEIDRVRDLFEEHISANPQAIDHRAHYNLLECAYNIKTGNSEKALWFAEGALLIRAMNSPDYRIGKADAYWALAGAHWANGQVGAAIGNAFNAITTSPVSIIKSS